MSHVFYALVPSAAQAHDAIAALDRLGMPREDISFVVRTGPVHDAEELALAETDARPGLADGALIGAIAGFLGIGLVGLPMGFVGAGPLAFAALGAVAGGTWGALGAGLVGLGLPERSLQPLIDGLHDGRVLVTVTAARREEEERVAVVFRQHGAVEGYQHRA
ncbi:hypothetical protein L6R53_28740 [Myxococcota bacterium]|nr:hypothetical protein [Myxococcota bacterium]